MTYIIALSWLSPEYAPCQGMEYISHPHPYQTLHSTNLPFSYPVDILRKEYHPFLPFTKKPSVKFHVRLIYPDQSLAHNPQRQYIKQYHKPIPSQLISSHLISLRPRPSLPYSVSRLQFPRLRSRPGHPVYETQRTEQKYRTEKSECVFLK